VPAAKQLEPSEDVSLGGVLDFMRLLWALNHELDSLSKRMASSFGVTGPQRLVVRIVGRHPEITPGALARVLRVHPSTLTGVLHRLVARGVVARHRDPADGRRALFSLTAAGRAIDALRAGTVEAAISRALRRFPPARLAAATAALEDMSKALRKETGHK
jgi:DNA-binding MarR family transcriptional regulator